jgi:hypothetical protein
MFPSHQCQPDWVSDERLAPCLRPPDERMHHMLHCDVMITFIGLDRLSAVPTVVIPSHTAKVTAKKEASPKHHARTPGPWMFNQTCLVHGEGNGRRHWEMWNVKESEERNRVKGNLWKRNVLYNSRKWCWIQNTHKTAFASLLFVPPFISSFQSCSISFVPANRCLCSREVPDCLPTKTQHMALRSFLSLSALKIPSTGLVVDIDALQGLPQYLLL